MIVFGLLTNIITYTIIKGEDVIDYHIEYNDLKKENEIRRSLFKISHEIKNPLAVIKAYVDIFDYNNIEKNKKYIKIISGEIDKMLLLLQDFLLVNKDNINFDIMDINLLLEDLVSTLYDLHKLKVELNIDDEEIYINGDYNRLTQVITNMVKNSYEANASEVEIKSYLKQHNVIIEVIDNGEGISKNISDKIFEPFFTTKKDGTGLGVPLSSEIVEAHGGTLVYLDNKNKGTIAKISLPIIDY
jgi:two-component system sporulation sensor kinase A